MILRTRTLPFLAALVVAVAGCGTEHSFVECESNADCNLPSGGGTGLCELNPRTDNKWCTYDCDKLRDSPAPDNCASGRCWSDFDTGDGVAGTCVADELPDGGTPVDAGVDAPITDGAIPDAAVVGCSQQILLFGSDRSGIYELYTMTSPDDPVVQITSGGGNNPDWSATGARIAYDSSKSGTTDIYVVDHDGTNEVRLTANLAVDQTPRWSPDGTKIAWVSGRDGNFEIYVMDANGDNKLRLTNNSIRDTDPRWSPDGTKILFTRDTDGAFARDVLIMNSDGSGQTNLTNNPADDRDATWMFDGSKILFVTKRDGNDEIYVMNADGSSPTNLSNNAAADTAPNWLRTSDTFVYVSDRSGKQQVYLASVTTPEPSEETGVGNNTAPNWGKDVNSLAFVSDRDGNHEIYVGSWFPYAGVNWTNDAATDTAPLFSPCVP